MAMTDSGRPDPSGWTVQEAVDRYLERVRRETTRSTSETYRLDLRQFVQWCKSHDIEQIADCTGYDFERYEADRAAALAPTSLENQMGLLKRFIAFCEDVGAVEDGLQERVHVPRADPADQSRDERLAVEDATRLLLHFRDRSNGLYGSKWHALLEVIWHTGCRLGGIIALDLEDYDGEANVLEFRHRPTQGTPLKNKRDGERDVGVLPEVADVLEAYIDETRFDRHDEHGRAPLFTTRSSQGRLSENAVRTWSYQATHPCWHTDDPCPHDKVRDDCGWTVADQSSKCPSSRAPHAVRTGSITFHRNRGFEKADVARRVNASMRTIERHYDKPDRREELETRRRPQLDKLSLSDHQEDEPQ